MNQGQKIMDHTELHSNHKVSFEAWVEVLAARAAAEKELVTSKLVDKSEYHLGDL
jgi:hypothetical protein